MAKLVKGSPEALAWSARMKRLQGKKNTNPGEQWHEREAGHAHTIVRKTPDPDEKVFYAGVESAHRISASAAKKLKMNPDGQSGVVSWTVLLEYVGHEGWKPLGKKRIAAFGRTVSGLEQVLQLEAQAWRVLFRNPNLAHTRTISLGTYKHLDHALIAANRQANDYLAVYKSAKKNPITIVGNPPNGCPEPPARFNVGVEGVLYCNVLEVAAEKQVKYKGFWYHPYKAKSRVQMLALDNGDLLIHSVNGTPLWKRD